MGYYMTTDEIGRALEAAPKETPEISGTYCYGEFCNDHVADYMATSAGFERPVCACQFKEVRFYILRGDFGDALLYYRDGEFSKSAEYHAQDRQSIDWDERSRKTQLAA
ncbi:hypothetical protein ACFWAP_00810 [Streptomyces goshikiensis]|uniref:hypothetical protein n=1 Tax=Streptomyces goshikiensis TaxID=1942 RepID=UPI00365D5BDE